MEKNPSKEQKVLFADEKTLVDVKIFQSTPLPTTGEPNPVTPTLSLLRLPSADSRSREACGLLAEESPRKKLKPSEDPSKKAKINVVKVASGEDVCHVDEELSPVAESEEEGLNGPEPLWRDGEHDPEEDPEEWIDRVADEVEEKGLQKMQGLERPEGSAKSIRLHAMCMIGERNLITMEVEQQARGGREDQG